MKTSEKLTKLNEAAARVLLWNEAIGKLAVTELGIEHQRERVLEELKELLTDVTSVGTIDGLCDVFVTATHLHYMITGEVFSFGIDDFSFESPNDHMGFLAMVLESFDELDSETIASGASCTVSELMITREEADFIGALEAVLKNNEDKFFSADRYTIADVQAHADAYKSEGTEVVVKDLVTGFDGYWLSRISDNKVMKPKGFVNVDLAPFVRSETNE